MAVGGIGVPNQGVGAVGGQNNLALAQQKQQADQAGSFNPQAAKAAGYTVTSNPNSPGGYTLSAGGVTYDIYGNQVAASASAPATVSVSPYANIVGYPGGVTATQAQLTAAGIAPAVTSTGPSLALGPGQNTLTGQAAVEYAQKAGLTNAQIAANPGILAELALYNSGIQASPANIPQVSVASSNLGTTYSLPKGYKFATLNDGTNVILDPSGKIVGSSATAVNQANVAAGLGVNIGNSFVPGITESGGKYYQAIAGKQVQVQPQTGSNGLAINPVAGQQITVSGRSFTAVTGNDGSIAFVPTFTPGYYSFSNGKQVTPITYVTEPNFYYSQIANYGQAMPYGATLSPEAITALNQFNSNPGQMMSLVVTGAAAPANAVATQGTPAYVVIGEVNVPAGLIQNLMAAGVPSSQMLQLFSNLSQAQAAAINNGEGYSVFYKSPQGGIYSIDQYNFTPVSAPGFSAASLAGASTTTAQTTMQPGTGQRLDYTTPKPTPSIPFEGLTLPATGTLPSQQTNPDPFSSGINWVTSVIKTLASDVGQWRSDTANKVMALNKGLDEQINVVVAQAAMGQINRNQELSALSQIAADKAFGTLGAVADNLPVIGNLSNFFATIPQIRDGIQSSDPVQRIIALAELTGLAAISTRTILATAAMGIPEDATALQIATKIATNLASKLGMGAGLLGGIYGIGGIVAGQNPRQEATTIEAGAGAGATYASLLGWIPNVADAIKNPLSKGIIGALQSALTNVGLVNAQSLAVTGFPASAQSNLQSAAFGAGMYAGNIGVLEPLLSSVKIEKANTPQTSMSDEQGLANMNQLLELAKPDIAAGAKGDAAILNAQGDTQGADVLTKQIANAQTVATAAEKANDAIAAQRTQAVDSDIDAVKDISSQKIGYEPTIEDAGLQREIGQVKSLYESGKFDDAKVAVEDLAKQFDVNSGSTDKEGYTLNQAIKANLDRLATNLEAAGKDPEDAEIYKELMTNPKYADVARIINPRLYEATTLSFMGKPIFTWSSEGYGIRASIAEILKTVGQFTPDNVRALQLIGLGNEYIDYLNSLPPQDRFAAFTSDPRYAAEIYNKLEQASPLAREIVQSNQRFGALVTGEEAPGLNDVISPRGSLTELYQSLAEVTTTEGGYLGGSAAVKLQLPTAAFRDIGDVDLEFSEKGDALLDKAQTLQEVAQKYYSRQNLDPNRVEVIEGKGTGPGTQYHLQDTETGNKLADINFEPNTPITINRDGIEMTDYKEILKDKLSIVQEGASPEKLTKAQKDIVLIRSAENEGYNPETLLETGQFRGTRFGKPEIPLAAYGQRILANENPETSVRTQYDLNNIINSLKAEIARTPEAAEGGIHPLQYPLTAYEQARVLAPELAEAKTPVVRSVKDYFAFKDIPQVVADALHDGVNAVKDKIILFGSTANRAQAGGTSPLIIQQLRAMIGLPEESPIGEGADLDQIMEDPKATFKDSSLVSASEAYDVNSKFNAYVKSATPEQIDELKTTYKLTDQNIQDVLNGQDIWKLKGLNIMTPSGGHLTDVHYLNENVGSYSSKDAVYSLGQKIDQITQKQTGQDILQAFNLRSLGAGTNTKLAAGLTPRSIQTGGMALTDEDLEAMGFTPEKGTGTNVKVQQQDTSNLIDYMRTLRPDLYGNINYYSSADYRLKDPAKAVEYLKVLNAQNWGMENTDVIDKLYSALNNMGLITPEYQQEIADLDAKINANPLNVRFENFPEVYAQGKVAFNNLFGTQEETAPPLALEAIANPIPARALAAAQPMQAVATYPAQSETVPPPLVAEVLPAYNSTLPRIDPSSIGVGWAATVYPSAASSTIQPPYYAGQYPYTYEPSYPYASEGYGYPSNAYAYSPSYSYGYGTQYPYSNSYPYSYPYPYTYHYPYNYPYQYPYSYPYQYPYQYPYIYPYTYPSRKSRSPPPLLSSDLGALGARRSRKIIDYYRRYTQDLASMLFPQLNQFGVKNINSPFLALGVRPAPEYLSPASRELIRRTGNLIPAGSSVTETEEVANAAG